MIPGAGRDPRQAAAMMRRLGMKTEPVSGVEEVVVRTKGEEHVFRAPEVTILTVQGVRTYQIVGTPVVRPRGAVAAAPSGPSGTPTTPPVAPSGPPEEDVRLVMEQANVSYEEAVEALQAAHGAPAEAILALLTRAER